MYQFNQNLYRHLLKRNIDIIISVVILISTSPLFLLLTVLLKISNRNAGVLFFQQRIGKDEKIFNVIKFKTMTEEQDSNGCLLSDEFRVTIVGKLLRSFSLDELPQLINVLKGDMSLIGPRPLLVQYLPLYSKEQTRRHEVRPGISGWAQVNGRNNISWEKKFEYDVWYVDNLSFILDLKIIFLTFKKVIIREGISSGSSLTMEAFRGNKHI